ncbi:MAG: hypothetical protein V3S82_11030 [Dehalococcoidia bacterium]
MGNGDHYFSLAQVIADAAGEFAKSDGFGVDSLAEYVLLLQGKLKAEELERAVNDGRKSVEDMKAAIKAVLSTARASAEKAGRTSISEGDVCGNINEGTRPPAPWCLNL